MTTLAEALEHAVPLLSPSETARRDAELLLLHVVKLSHADLLTHPERELTERELNHFHAAIARRAQHEPVQHILGHQQFYGREFIVNRLVLIPRPETEHLVEAALTIDPRPGRILDIGTGSGALAITLALELPDAAVTATDISIAAIAVAQKNAQQLGAAERIRFITADLFAALGDERFDCILSNPPYVPVDEILEPQVREYEPAPALYAGKDGLAIYRRLIPQATGHLEPGGHLLLEIGHGQRDAVHKLLEQGGLQKIRFLDDLQGIPRVAISQKATGVN